MFSVVTDSQFELPQIFISQIERGSIALSLRWVSVKRGIGIGASAGVGFYLFSKECCFRVRLTVSVKPNPNLKPKTAIFKKTDRPRPRPGTDPAFYWHPKINGRGNIDLECNFEKKKIRLKSFEIVTTFRYKRRIKVVLYKKTHGISFRFHSRSDDDTKYIFRWFKGLSKVNIEKLFILKVFPMKNIC